MATQFVSATTGEWVATRWYGGRERGTCWDFGARHEAAFEAFEASEQGEQFVSERGEVMTGEEFRATVMAAEMTFGEYGGTFESGSADEFRFAGF